jgi:cytochrome c-type biogenesis protein CcmH/NrfF
MVAQEWLWLQPVIVTLAIIVDIVVKARLRNRLRKRMDAIFEEWRAEMRAATDELRAKNSAV